MDERTFHFYALIVFAIAAVVTFPVLFFIDAPYGRHDTGSGVKINATLGWMVMEAPSSIIVGAMFLASGRTDAASWAFVLLWQLHYVHRAFVFPFQRRGGNATMPLSIAAGAFAFNVCNGYLVGRALFHFEPVRERWLSTPWFLSGVALFLIGYAINRHSDRVLFSLRKPGERGYKIPHGGLYRYVSSPNYFGEIVEWCGFALLTLSPAALVFAIWTIANLAPRARSNHRWYHATFSEYPRERKALIPFMY
jgi:steroid 5-alpha reductase family enzyme